MTEEEYLEKYRVTEYRIVRYPDSPCYYSVEFFEPLSNHWECWTKCLTLREARCYLRAKRCDERRFAKIVKKEGMNGLHDAWSKTPTVYYYKEKK